MWRLWSGLLEALGRIRFRFPSRRTLVLGDPDAADARGGSEWQEFTTPEALFRVWGPLEGSPWEPFHSVPLFAALDRVSPGKVGPTSHRSIWERSPHPLAHPGAPAPAWPTPDTWTIVDLPGPLAVEVAAWLVTSAGAQPVCSFDHWPHPKGVLSPEHILAELLRWASTLAAARGRIAADAPPVWVCDSQRLGNRPGRPGEFDNRYFLDDSALPGPAILHRAGIRRVVYISPGFGELPVPDLEAYLGDLLQAGIELLHARTTDPELEPLPMSAPRTPRPPPRKGFHRSAAGGFGTVVPEPSSGGGGG
jgi:hypothetical protein